MAMSRPETQAQAPEQRPTLYLPSPEKMLTHLLS